MKLFGEKNSFAIEVLDVNSSLVQANVFVSGLNITPINNFHYDQYFVHGALGVTSEFFIDTVDWFRYENKYTADCVEERFRESVESGGIGWSSLFSWQPCTNGFICDLVPFRSRLYLCSANLEDLENVYLSVVLPYNIARVLITAREYAVSISSNPYMKLELK